MAENKPIHGKDKILKFRLLEEADKKDGAKLALQTEHEWSYERENNSTITKDGNVQSSTGLTVTLDISAVVELEEIVEVEKVSEELPSETELCSY